jgi:acyl carrier protein
MNEEFTRQDVQAADSLKPDAQTIEVFLIMMIADRLDLPPETIDPQNNFIDYGFDSIALMTISGELEKWLGIRLSPVVAWEQPTLNALAQYLAAEVRRASPYANTTDSAPPDALNLDHLSDEQVDRLLTELTEQEH